VIAVGTFAEAHDEERLASALEWALSECDLDYAGIGDAMADSQDVVGVIGGRAICTFHDPAGGFAAMWEKLRPIREQNWRVGVGGGKHNNMATLFFVFDLRLIDPLVITPTRSF